MTWHRPASGGYTPTGENEPGTPPTNPASATPAVGDYERFRDRAEDALRDAAAFGGAHADRHVAKAAVYAQLAQAAAWREK